MKSKYPINHQFRTTIDRGDTNPHSIELVTVIGHWNDKADADSGVSVRADDGTTMEISYRYLQEDGSGH